MKSKFTLLLFFLTITFSYGQYKSWIDGELILKNGDTLKGMVKLPMISTDLFAMNGKEKIKYRQSRDSKKIKYGEDQIEKVIVNDLDTGISHFEFVKTSKNKKELFKIIISGRAKLYWRTIWYSSSGATRNETEEFYVLKENETIAKPLISSTAIFSSFKQRAIASFSDCPEIVSKLENQTYSRWNVMSMVSEYNNCK